MSWFSEEKIETYEIILATCVTFEIVSGTIFLTILSQLGPHLCAFIVCGSKLSAQKPMKMYRSLERNLKTYFD